MSMRSKGLARGARVVVSCLVALAGCGDDVTPSGGGGEAGAGGSGAGGSGAGAQGGGGDDAGGGGAGAQGGGGADGGGGSGGGTVLCAETLPRATKGGAVAVSADDATVVVANRDVGTVTVLGVDYTSGLPDLVKRAELGVGAEPWQVAIDGCGERAYAVSRRDQKLVVLDALSTTPVVLGEVAVGSEPTGLALSPNNTRVYVANWVDGTVSVIDAETLTVVDTVDLNAVLADTGLLGPSVSAAASRPALAHPRSIAITNDGDGDDDDETIVVTEFFGQRTAPEAEDGSNVDVNWDGVLYTIDAATLEPGVIGLGPRSDVGFEGAGMTGCFVNQVLGVTVRGGLAFVTSVCASPRGPTNPKQMTHPAVSIVDLATKTELPESPVMLDGAMVDFYTANSVADDATRRVPLLAGDVVFDEATGAAYVSASGVDAVFRFVFDPATGAVTEAGSGPTKPFFDLSSDALDEALRGQNPEGLAVAHEQPFAFVANDVSRNVTALAIAPAVQEIAGVTAGAPRVVASTDLPSDPGELAALRGKRAFTTGLDRFSLNGQGWGSCASCHFEGLSDNVTWYFARGPRQSTSLDGSFASSDPSDQRIFNWTAVADEFADFEAVLRALDGGVGAIVHTVSDPPVNSDRIDLANTTLFPGFGAAGLNGSAELAVDMASVLQTWDDLEVYAQRVRSPRAATNLDPVKVQQGAALFAGAGGCTGCHGGEKWTMSTLFYTPGSDTNQALRSLAYDGAALVAAGFPAELLPAPTDGTSQRMRSGTGPGDVMQCLLRPVGTFDTSPAGVNAIEVRQDMMTVAYGDEAVGKGYNVPSVLGMQVGAPFYHAGNARTLEELFDGIFAGHHGPLADDGFLSGGGAAAQRDALVHYLLSLDEASTPLALPASAGADGGDFCASP